MTNALMVSGSSLGSASKPRPRTATSRSRRSDSGSFREQRSTARPSSACGRWLPGGKTDHQDFIQKFNPCSRPSTAGSARSELSARSFSRPGSSRPQRAARPDSAQSTASVRPEFVFTKPAMKNIAEWMATEAEHQERAAFRKVHDLLAIETAPGGEPSRPVEQMPTAEAVECIEDAALEDLNAGLNAITMQCWRDNLRSTYNDQFSHGASAVTSVNDPGRTKEKVWQLLGNIVNDDAIDYVSERIDGLQKEEAGLVWDTLQKLSANEETLQDNKQTISSVAHSWNPFYKKEPRRTDYPNLSTALPLEKTFYPPGMKPPPRPTGPDKALLRMQARLNDPKTLSQMTHNTLTAAAATAHHPNDIPPPTPASEEREQYYGSHRRSYGVEGGPHTTYTNQARNPYWEEGRPDPVAPPRKFVLDQAEEEPELPEQEPEAQAVEFSAAMLQQNAKAELLGSSIPLDMGLPMPYSSYAASFSDPATKFNPNTKGPTGTNAHMMPTQCITGMAAAGGPKSSKPSATHIEFLRRLSKSRANTRPQSAVSRPKSAAPRARPHSASASRLSHRSGAASGSW